MISSLVQQILNGNCCGMTTEEAVREGQTAEGTTGAATPTDGLGSRLRERPPTSFSAPASADDDDDDDDDPRGDRFGLVGVGSRLAPSAPSGGTTGDPTPTDGAGSRFQGRSIVPSPPPFPPPSPSPPPTPPTALSASADDDDPRGARPGPVGVVTGIVPSASSGGSSQEDIGEVGWYSLSAYSSPKEPVFHTTAPYGGGGDPLSSPPALVPSSWSVSESSSDDAPFAEAADPRYDVLAIGSRSGSGPGLMPPSIDPDGTRRWEEDRPEEDIEREEGAGRSGAAPFLSSELVSSDEERERGGKGMATAPVHPTPGKADTSMSLSLSLSSTTTTTTTPSPAGERTLSSSFPHVGVLPAEDIPTAEEAEGAAAGLLPRADDPDDGRGDNLTGSVVDALTSSDDSSLAVSDLSSVDDDDDDGETSTVASGSLLGARGSASQRPATTADPDDDDDGGGERVRLGPDAPQRPPQDGPPRPSPPRS